MPLRTRSLACVILLAAALAGCGDSASTDTDQAATTAPAAGTDTSGTASTATPPATASQASLSSPGYGPKAFTLDSCSLNADVSNASLRGSADGMKLTVDASEGKGTLGVAGGTEADGITLNGDVSAVSVTDRAFSITGTFGAPNLSGEAFTLQGSCPE